MPYKKDVFDAALRRLEQRKLEAEEETQRVREEAYMRVPRLEKIRRELADTAMETVREILTGGNAEEKIQSLKKMNLNLQAERAELLTANGMPDDLMEPKYFCSKCKDTGFMGDKICDCLRSLLRDEACKRANSGSPLPLRSFDSFSLSYYPENDLPGINTTARGYMNRVYSFCKDYAEEFTINSPSLLFLGGTGLGKTHLALAIANEVLAKGYSVIYDTAQNVFSKMEEEQFRRMDKFYTQTVYDCDLLILDELPDYATSFTNNMLYNIINTRTLAPRPTIVSTNLTEKELEARYGQKIFSRLIGDFWMFKFFGKDIRQQKLRKK